MSSRLPEVLQLLKYWAYDSMHVAFILLSILVFLSWFMHALFTSCSPVLAQHASSKFDVPLMTPGGCGQWVQACRLSGRVTLSHCHALTPSHHISRHSQAALPLDLCRRGVVCFVSGFGFRWMLWCGIPWHPVASRLPGPKLDLGGKRKARQNSHYRCPKKQTVTTSLLVTTYHLNETDISWL